jgi:hypothetical protein
VVEIAPPHPEPEQEQEKEKEKEVESHRSEGDEEKSASPDLSDHHPLLPLASTPYAPKTIVPEPSATTSSFPSVPPQISDSSLCVLHPTMTSVFSQRKDLAAVIQKLDPSSSSGADGWSVALLKRCLSDDLEILPLLKVCLNYLFLLCWFPRCWFVDRIIGIPKTGKPTETRPITITNLFRKIIAKSLLFLYRPLLASYLPQHQYGVGVPCGTETISTILSDSIDASRLAGEEIVISQLDISSAFPTVDHKLFLSKLIRLQTPPALISFFHHSFLHRRLFFFETDTPSEVKCSIGLPEGCPLSPMAFSIYTSDAITAVNEAERSSPDPSSPFPDPSSPFPDPSSSFFSSPSSSFCFFPSPNPCITPQLVAEIEKEKEKERDDERSSTHQFSPPPSPGFTPHHQNPPSHQPILVSCKVPKCVAYLDDIFLISSSPSDAASSMEILLNHLSALHLTVNFNKTTTLYIEKDGVPKDEACLTVERNLGEEREQLSSSSSFSSSSSSS